MKIALNAVHTKDEYEYNIPETALNVKVKAKIGYAACQKDPILL